MLGDAEGPADHRPVGVRELMRHLSYDLGGHVGDALSTLERPVRDALGVLLEILGRVRDERVILQVAGDDLPRDRVRQRDVGADVDPEPEIGERRGLGPPWIDDDQLRPSLERPQDVVEEDGVCRAGVRAPQHDEVAVLDLLI
jgi:hypothetical protein